MKKTKCIIIDDEPLAIKVIDAHLKEFHNFEVVARFHNPIEALSIIETEQIDVIFLDINMPKMNGLEFLKSVHLKDVNIVITTAYREYAVESFTLDVLDYLVKPIPFNRFLKTINKITQKQAKSSTVEETSDKESFIFLKVDKKMIKIKFDDVFYIESLKDYIKVVTKLGNYLVHKSLTSITEELPKNKFLRVHRSFTIALDKIKSLEGNSVEIENTRIPIGRKYINHTKKIILDS